MPSSPDRRARIEHHRKVLNPTGGHPSRRARECFQSLRPFSQRTYACSFNLHDDPAEGLRYASRTLRKMPGFTLVALLVLGLGIGANTAIFSVVNSVLLRPLPFPGADRMAVIWETDLKDGVQREGPSAPNFLDWQEQSQSFEEMTLLGVGTGTVTGQGEPEQVVGAAGDYELPVDDGRPYRSGARIQPSRRRRPSRYPVAVLTNGYWKRRFASDPNVIGKTFILNSEPLQRGRRAGAGFLAAAARPIFLSPGR
ncbi:MAG: ABC transporter permease [Ignavibacteriota bacterium]